MCSALPLVAGVGPVFSKAILKAISGSLTLRSDLFYLDLELLSTRNRYLSVCALLVFCLHAPPCLQGFAAVWFLMLFRFLYPFASFKNYAIGVVTVVLSESASVARPSIRAVPVPGTNVSYFSS